MSMDFQCPTRLTPVNVRIYSPSILLRGEQDDFRGVKTGPEWEGSRNGAPPRLIQDPKLKVGKGRGLAIPGQTA
jgi:hypothetical protein